MSARVFVHKEIRSFEDAEKLIGKANKAGRPLVIKFYAPWCPPCGKIADWFEMFSAEHSATTDFAIMNIDDDGDVPAAYGVKMIPTFHVWDNGVRVGSFGREPVLISDTLSGILARRANRSHGLTATHRESAEVGYLGDDEHKDSPVSPVSPERHHELSIIAPERTPTDGISAHGSWFADQDGENDDERDLETPTKKQKMGGAAALLAD